MARAQPGHPDHIPAAGVFVGARPDLEVDVAVVVVTFHSADDIGTLIADLRVAAADGATIRMIVVDNDSRDATADEVSAHPDVVLVESGGNLGYAGGINVGLQHIGRTRAVLILNPDLRVTHGAVDALLAAAQSPGVGAVVPLIRDIDGTVYPSLRFEPSITRMIGDSVFGRALWTRRPGWLSEFDYRPTSYRHTHDVDWATGAAVLVPAEVVAELGAWDERFFLYSEETEYFRRIRESGRRIRFTPDAEVIHELGGSGTSPALAALLAVNRVRYARLHHRTVYCALFRAAVALGELLRSYDPAHRRTLAIVARESRWHTLPAARPAPPVLTGPRGRGTVIIPAYDEAAVIEHTLAPLSRAAVDGYFEVIVVCNGCTDDTADRARAVAGVRVVEIDTGSKTLALNTGDELATGWPRLYLDADIEITPATVLAVLDRLTGTDILAARPAFRYGTEGVGPLVRSYYRARERMTAHRTALWWAGVYGLNRSGHARFGRFPDVTGDDKFVDAQFADTEKTVVDAEPSVWRTPTTARGLLTVLTRHQRGNTELAASAPRQHTPTASRTARAVLATIRGPGSAADAATYLTFAVLARIRAKRSTTRWERDDTSRALG